MGFKVAVGINYWDDPKGLLKILTNDTVYEYIDRFYIINGKYFGRYDKPEFPSDYIDDLKSIYSKIKLYNMSDVKQIDKRNKYWELAEKEGIDYLIVLDSDEYLDINPSVFNSSLRIINNRPERCYPIIQYMEGVTTVKRPRLFKAPFDYRHVENKSGNGISHGSIYENYGESDKEIIQQMYAWYNDHPKRSVGDNHVGVPGIEMWHDKEYRSRERVIADRVFYDKNPNR